MGRDRIKGSSDGMNEGTRESIAELNRENRRWAGKGKRLFDGVGSYSGRCFFCKKIKSCDLFHPQLEAISEVEMVCSDCYDTNTSFMALRKKWKKWILDAPTLGDGWGAENNKCVFCKKITYCFPFYSDLDRKSQIVGVCEKCESSNLKFRTVKDTLEKWIDEYGVLCHGHNIKYHPSRSGCKRCSCG